MAVYLLLGALPVEAELCFVVCYFMSLMGKRELICFALFVFLVSRDCCVALSHSALVFF